MRSSTTNPRLKRILFVVLSAFAGVILFAGTGAAAKSAAVSATTHENDGPKPTIVLIHGAFADASGWGGVITRLQHRGYTVLAPANPLRGVAGDSRYIASVLAT